MFVTEQTLPKRHLAWQTDVLDEKRHVVQERRDRVYYRSDAGSGGYDKSSFRPTNPVSEPDIHHTMSAVDATDRHDTCNFTNGKRSPNAFRDSSQSQGSFYYPQPRSTTDGAASGQYVPYPAYPGQDAYDFFKQYDRMSGSQQPDQPQRYAIADSNSPQMKLRENGNYASSRESMHYDENKLDDDRGKNKKAECEQSSTSHINNKISISPPPPKLIPIGERIWHRPSSDTPKESYENAMHGKLDQTGPSKDSNEIAAIKFASERNDKSSENVPNEELSSESQRCGISPSQQADDERMSIRKSISPAVETSSQQKDGETATARRDSFDEEFGSSDSNNIDQIASNGSRSLSPISESAGGENINHDRPGSPENHEGDSDEDERHESQPYDFSKIKDYPTSQRQSLIERNAVDHSNSEDSMSPERYRSHSFSFSPGRYRELADRRMPRSTTPPSGYPEPEGHPGLYLNKDVPSSMSSIYPLRPDPLTALLQKYSGPVPSFQFPGMQNPNHENSFPKPPSGVPSTPPKYPVPSSNGYSPARGVLSPRQPDSFPSPATPTRSRSLDADLSRQGSQEFYYCHLCSYVGNSKFHFNAHMNSHFEHACPHCDYTSRTEGRLKRHIKDFHSEEIAESGQMMRRQPGRPKVFKCRQCEFVTENKEQFWDHSRTHIKDDKILQCPKCPFVTEYKHHLEYHLRNHFGSKPFKCPKCNYSCVNKSMLNSHMKSHTNVYQYRCADCTYATKYCHSLKLHLKKYNHKPATVLNPDGSLPTDGSGDFELVSKRGPPRGPRGPKREGKSPPPPPPPPPVFPSPGMKMTIPQSMGMMPGGAMPNHMNGGMMGSNGYWQPAILGAATSSIQGQPPPLIPVSNVAAMNPLSVQVSASNRSFAPSSASNSFTPSSSSSKTKLELKTSSSPVEADGSLNLSSKPIEIAPVPQGMTMKCRFCEFTADSRQVLLQHNLRVHAAENQDLFTVFGIRAESLVGEGDKQQSSEAIREAIMKSSSMLGIKSEDHHKNSTSSLSSSPQDQHHNYEHDTSNKNTSQKLMPSTRAESHSNAERPLDLSTFDKFDGSPSNEEARALAVPSRKRSSEDSQNSGEGIVGSDSISSTQRKRSRKGKAYKLDVIAMKLQGQFDSSPRHGDAVNEDECAMSDYASDDNKIDGMETEPCQPGDEVDELSFSASENVNESSLDKHEMNHLGIGDMEEANSVSGKCPKVTEIPNAHKVLQVMQRLEAEYEGRKQHSEVTDQEYSEVKNADNSSKYECPHCSISFADCIMYSMHMGYHDHKDPFKCTMCGQQSVDKVEFFLHIARAAHA